MIYIAVHMTKIMQHRLGCFAKHAYKIEFNFGNAKTQELRNRKFESCKKGKILYLEAIHANQTCLMVRSFDHILKAYLSALATM